MGRLAVQVKRLPHGADLPLPHYATPDSAGVDLVAAIEDAVVLAPGERQLTGGLVGATAIEAERRSF